MIDDDEDDNEYGACGGMRSGRGNQSIRRNPAQCHLNFCFSNIFLYISIIYFNIFISVESASCILHKYI